MNKKRIIALVMSTMMLMPTVAYAKGNDNGKEHEKHSQATVQITAGSNTENDNEDSNKQQSDQAENKDKQDRHDKQEKKDNENKGNTNAAAKKANNEAFKTAIRAKHAIMKANNQKLVELRKEIAAKRAEIGSLIDALNSGSLTLSDNLVNQLISQAPAVTQDGQQVQNTGDLNTAVDETQGDINGGRFDSALAALDNVIAKQEARYQALLKLSSDLDAIIATLKQATVPPTTSTGTDTTGSTTTTDPNSGSTTTTDSNSGSTSTSGTSSQTSTSTDTSVTTSGN